MCKYKYWSHWLVILFWLLILWFLLSGCLIQNGRIATEKEILEHPQSVEARKDYVIMSRKVDDSRKYIKSYEIIWGWWDKL